MEEVKFLKASNYKCQIFRASDYSRINCKIGSQRGHVFAAGAKNKDLFH
jgi:hypothetical protein